jgi:hypothetical protein
MYILIDRKGKLSEIKNVDVNDYGKRKCIWKINGKIIYLYGRTKQKESTKIVKYDFPPPVDNKIFYGQCLIVDSVNPLTIVEWEKIYEELMGGFEDINSESDVSEEDTTDLPMTKEGYVKDGFVVSDSEE